jgi:hypothetical protein
VLDEEDRQRIAGAKPGHPPSQLLSGRGAPPPVRRVSDVDAAPAHGGHVGGQIVALNGQVPEATAPPNELDEGGAGLALLTGANAEDLQVIVLEERDRVLRAGARMDATIVNVEANPAVRLHAGVQVRHADHGVIDAGQGHEISSPLSFTMRRTSGRAYNTPGSPSRIPATPCIPG